MLFSIVPHHQCDLQGVREALVHLSLLWDQLHPVTQRRLHDVTVTYHSFKYVCRIFSGWYYISYNDITATHHSTLCSLNTPRALRTILQFNFIPIYVSSINNSLKSFAERHSRVNQEDQQGPEGQFHQINPATQTQHMCILRYIMCI